MDNKSAKHHFIPVFYQKGFVSDNNEMFAYKKKYGNIKNWSPSQIMYKKNLHTVTLGNKSTVMIEKFYSKMEGQFNDYLGFIKNNINNTELIQNLMNDSDFQRLTKLMIATQFWRTPCRRKQAIDFVPKLMGLYDSADNEIKDVFNYDRDFIQFLVKRSKKDDCLKFIQFLLLPLLTFDLSTRLVKLKLFRANENKTFMSSDRPVIFKNTETLFNFSSVLFPFSKELLLFCSEENIKYLNVDTVNLLIAKNALEVVISDSREQLEDLKNKLNLSVTV